MDDDPDAPTAPAARRHGRRRLPQVLWALTLVALAVAVGGFVTDANTVPQEGVPGNNGSRGLWLGILGGMGATLAGLAASLTSLSSRTQVWAAKLVVVSAWSMGVVLTTMLVSGALGWLFLHDDDVRFGTSAMAEQVGRTLLYSLIFVAIVMTFSRTVPGSKIPASNPAALASGAVIGVPSRIICIAWIMKVSSARNNLGSDAL